jgi:hypothetical protein
MHEVFLLHTLHSHYMHYMILHASRCYNWTDCGLNTHHVVVACTRCHDVFFKLPPKEVSLTRTQTIPASAAATADLVPRPPAAAANWLARYYAASNQAPKLTRPNRAHGPLDSSGLGTSAAHTAAHTPGTGAQQMPAWTAGGVHIG